MPNNLKTKNSWLMPPRKLEHANLADDEQLTFAMHYQVDYRNSTENAQVIFLVVKKGNKAIARNIICHGNQFGFCAGHADDLAEYDISDMEELIEETKNHALAMTAMLLNEGPNFPLTIDQSRPILAMKPPLSETRQGIINKLNSEAHPDNKISAPVLIRVLGLEKDVTNQPQAQETITPAFKEEKKATNNLEKAAQEMELIKKFGKKNIESLAKKMNYEGELINNKKKQTHANKN